LGDLFPALYAFIKQHKLSRARLKHALCKFNVQHRPVAYILRCFGFLCQVHTSLSLPVVGAPGTITSNSIDEKFNTVRVGLNYRLGDEYAPLK
jgi:hypothetical protein